MSKFKVGDYVKVKRSDDSYQDLKGLSGRQGRIVKSILTAGEKYGVDYNGDTFWYTENQLVSWTSDFRHTYIRVNNMQEALIAIKFYHEQGFTRTSKNKIEDLIVFDKGPVALRTSYYGMNFSWHLFDKRNDENDSTIQTFGRIKLDSITQLRKNNINPNNNTMSTKTTTEELIAREYFDSASVKKAIIKGARLLQSTAEELSEAGADIAKVHNVIANELTKLNDGLDNKNPEQVAQVLKDLDGVGEYMGTYFKNKVGELVPKKAIKATDISEKFSR